MPTHAHLRATLIFAVLSIAGACAGGAATPEAPLTQPAVTPASPAAEPDQQPAAEPAATPDAQPEAKPAGATPKGVGLTEELAQDQARRKAQRQAARQTPEGVATEPQPDGNWLADASFEGHLRWDEGQPWWNPLKVQDSQAWVEFAVVEGRARTGQRAALLSMDSTAQPGPTRVHGVVQEVAPKTMPRYLSGWYRVEGWERGTPKQYLQAVVIAREPSNLPPTLRRHAAAGMSVQVAMTLAGVTQPPLTMFNRRFEVSGPAEPVQGEWVFFEFDLPALYTKHWLEVPKDSATLRVFFEVRYDDKQGVAPARAQVLFDDLYLGDESRAPTPAAP